MSSSENSIIIVGAGPGGLVLSYLLALNGLSVRVFEKAKDFDREFRGEFLQPSAMPLLQQLGIVQELEEAQRILAVDAVRMHFRNTIVSTSEDGSSDAAGFLVHQPTLLNILRKRGEVLPNFRIDMSSAITGFSTVDGQVKGVIVKCAGQETVVSSKFVIVCNGRVSSLRTPLGLSSKTLEEPYTILWQRFDMSQHLELLPAGLNGYVGSRALCVTFPSHGNRLQVMWRRRPKYVLPPNSSEEILNRTLLEDLPPYWRNVVSKVIDLKIEQQALRVVSDCLKSWWSPGVLFIGDAAHSMSPIGGQGLAMAIRDAVVAANHIIETHKAGLPIGDQVSAAIQFERTPEIRSVQQFQRKAASLHVASPIKQWLIAKLIIPLVTAIRGKSYMHDLKHGFTQVHFRHFPTEY